MIAISYVGSCLLLMLGLGFMLVWRSDRLNRPALMWGLAHTSLAIASFTGYTYQLNNEGSWGAVAFVTTAVFLRALWESNEALSRRATPVRRLVWQSLLILLCLLLIAMSLGQLAGRLSVMLSMMALYGWSAYLFHHQFKLKWIAFLFAFKVVAYLTFLTNLSTFSTTLQPVWMSLLNWGATIALALGLVHVAVTQSRRRLMQVIKHLPDALVVRQLDGTVMFCNDAFARLAGAASPVDLLGQPTPWLSPATTLTQDISREVNAMTRAGLAGERVVLERDFSPKVGASFPAEIIFSSFIDVGQTLLIGQIRDLSERKNAERERLKQATTDETTGLPNRRLLDERLASILWECERTETLCAVLMIDLDHFKRINDLLGHLKGDEVIRQVGQTLQACCHPKDVLGRFSGDKFVVIMTTQPPLHGQQAAQELAQRLCTDLQQTMVIEQERLQLSASIGIAVLGVDGQTATQLLQHAEVAMYEAKAAGRRTWRFFNQEMDDKRIENLRLEAALRLALPNQELHLFYQPIVNASTGEMSKVEALLRWNSATLGAVSPARFIPLAEESTLILELGAWVLDEAVRQAAFWAKSEGLAPIISINISVRQFMQPDFELRLMDTLNKHQVTPAQLELELTETLLASDDASLSLLLQRLWVAGFSLSLDDFGTGYSSLSYLIRFHLNTVKIDRSFVMSLESDKRHQALAQTIIAMGHSLGLKVVAEGVETAAQCHFLTQHGCDYLQGYLLGKPGPAHALQLSPLICSKNSL